MKQHTGHFNEKDYQNSQRVAYLIVGYVRSTLTDLERDELDEWLCASEENMLLFADLTNKENLDKELQLFDSFNREAAIQKILAKLDRNTDTPQKNNLKLIYAIAAFLLLYLSIYFISRYYINEPNFPPAVANKIDIPAGSNKAMLQLPDGTRIPLDSSPMPQVAGIDVANENGKLVYKGSSQPVEYHSLTTPMGGQYQLVLSDSTRVWLNAASSIRYPTIFPDKERVVEVSGEVYFEVSKNPKKKFIVKTSNLETEVLGTHFNVNAYPDENAPSVTLLEGRVAVHISQAHDSASFILEPGQQLSVTAAGTQINHPDLETITAWKDGLFEFKQESIEVIMQQVARWYDVKVAYEGKVNYHFNASIERKEPISKLFALLEMTDKVHFNIKGNTVIVKP